MRERKVPEAYTREDAIHDVKRRLKISKWFSRAMLAVGLSSGLFIADSPAEGRTADGFALASLVAATVASPLEKLRARKRADETVLLFSLRHSLDSGTEDAATGDFVTVLQQDGEDLAEHRLPDFKAISGNDNFVATISMGPPFLGGVGAAFMARETFTGLVDESHVDQLTRTGETLLAMGALVFALDEFAIHQKTESCVQKINNIDGGMRFVG